MAQESTHESGVMPGALDDTDVELLRCLQENARIANVELASKVGLSPGPCLRRLRALEESGVIRQYSCLIDPRAVRLALTAWVRVRLDLQVAKRFELFEHNIVKRPEVLECYLLTGHEDYLVRAVVADVSGYERFLKESLSRIEGVVSTSSSFGLRVVKYSTALPLSSGHRDAAVAASSDPAVKSANRERRRTTAPSDAAPLKLDEIDLHILVCLQENARMSNVALADRVGLSPAPCLRRVRALEQGGVIRKYVTLINPSAVNLGVIVWTQVRLDLQVAQRFSFFEQNSFRWREVPEVYQMAGDADYLVRVVVPSVFSYEKFLNGFLSRTEGVVSTNSSFVLKVVKHTTALPLSLMPGAGV